MFRRVTGAFKWFWLQLKRLGPPLKDAAPIGADAIIATFRIVRVAFVEMATIPLPNAIEKTQAGALAGLIALVLAVEIALDISNTDAITVGLGVLMYVGAVALAVSAAGTAVRSIAKSQHPARSVGRAITDVTAAFIVGLAALIVTRIGAAVFLTQSLVDREAVPAIVIDTATAVAALFSLFRRSRNGELCSEKFVSAAAIASGLYLGLVLVQHLPQPP